MLNHAFIISVHTNFEQIKLLVSTLSFGDTYIHVDKKQDVLYGRLLEEYKDKSNVTIIPDRVSVNWSGLSQVVATLHLLNNLVASKKDYDYVHFISGQDLLLLSHEDLDRFISSKGQNKEFIEVNEIGKYGWRLTKYSFFRENPKNRTFKYRLADNFLRIIQKPFVHRSNLKGFNLYKGSQWFSLTKECIDYIHAETQSNDYLNRYKYTACPDEHFFQILIMNSPFKNHVVKNNFRYIVFEGYNASPNTLSMKDYDSFMNGEYMFARKFDLNSDDKVIHRVIEQCKRNR